jgi:hypothetical protein
MLRRQLIANLMVRVAATLVSAFLAGQVVSAQASTASEPETGKTLTPARIRQLLRQPNGLEAAANLTGNFVMNGQRHLWGDLDLPTLVSQSALAIVGTVTKEEARLSDDGDYIYTDVSVQPLKVLKGSAAGSVTFSIPGGLYRFANGNTAQVTTIEWRELQVGEKYILLLVRDNQGRYIPTNGIESLFRFPADGSAPEPFAKRDNRPHQINNNVKGLTADGVISAIQTAARLPNP